MRAAGPPCCRVVRSASVNKPTGSRSVGSRDHARVLHQLVAPHEFRTRSLPPLRVRSRPALCPKSRPPFLDQQIATSSDCAAKERLFSFAIHAASACALKVPATVALLPPSRLQFREDVERSSQGAAEVIDELEAAANKPKNSSGSRGPHQMALRNRTPMAVWSDGIIDA